MLISASPYGGMQSEVLDREPCLSAVSLAHGLHMNLAEVASKSSGDHAEEDSLGNMAEKLERWTMGGGEPIVAISARGGIVAGTAGTIAMAAQNDVYAASARDTNIGAGGSIFARASKGVSILACKLGMKLIAAGGDVKIQSQNGCIEISTTKQIKLWKIAAWVVCRDDQCATPYCRKSYFDASRGRFNSRLLKPSTSRKKSLNSCG